MCLWPCLYTEQSAGVCACFPVCLLACWGVNVFCWGSLQMLKLSLSASWSCSRQLLCYVWLSGVWCLWLSRSVFTGDYIQTDWHHSVPCQAGKCHWSTGPAPCQAGKCQWSNGPASCQASKCHWSTGPAPCQAEKCHWSTDPASHGLETVTGRAVMLCVVEWSVVSVTL